ncbi:hypothetical protein [Promineifilum sp.]|uniref:hypothetical protein n=1 Tax=Promineifilum sp. TaxID=2664178 RepID=UPI0035B29C7A
MSGIGDPPMPGRRDIGAPGHEVGTPASIGQELIDHDPDHNLLLSVHAYWAGFDGRPHI